MRVRDLKNPELVEYYSRKDVIYVLSKIVANELPNTLTESKDFYYSTQLHPIVQKYWSLFENTTTWNHFITTVQNHYNGTEQLDENWKKKALAGALAAGIAFGAGVGKAKADDSVQQVAYQPAKQEQVIKDIKTFVHSYVDFDKLPWYAPSKDEVTQQVADAYEKALKDGTDVNTIIKKVGEYLKKGGTEEFKNLYSKHTTKPA
jgi:hypothetical protein